MRNIFSLYTILFIFLPLIELSAQNSVSSENRADSLHKQYQFDKAIDIYKQILSSTTDSLKKINIEKKIVLSTNGKNMLNFGFKPKTIGKIKTSFNRFFLRYPGFENNSWINTPSELCSELNNFSYTYFPENADQIVYSAPDKDGSWNIYSITKVNDTLWSAPKLLNENITTIGNEIFPYLSKDGKTLYFSSNGHFGSGGYDLYQSNWNEEINDWDTPQNMGFPYSTPANDYLLYNTPDGLYTIFASDRETQNDSLCLYAIEFENIPLKTVFTPEQAVKIAKLDIGQEREQSLLKEDTKEELSNDQNPERYTLAVNRVRDLQKQLDSIIKSLESNRKLYNELTNNEDLAAIEREIAKQEILSMNIQIDLTKASDSLQQIEMDFLTKGIILSKNEENINDQANNNNLEDKKTFKFAFNKLGKISKLIVEKAEPDINVVFSISDEESIIFDINDIPESLIYQIQLFSLSQKASTKSLKGINPVFERKTSAGRYIYSVGIFNSYNEALKQINAVKRKGFSGATLVAYNEKKPITIRNARILEKKNLENYTYQIAIKGFEEGLPENLIKAIRENSEKDIAKIIEEGKTIYVIGPFAKKTEADNLSAILKSVSDADIEIEQKEIK